MISNKFEVVADVKELILADICFEIFSVWITSDLNPNYSEAIDSQLINETFNGYHILDETINMLVFKMRGSNYKQVVEYIASQVKTLDLEMIEILKRKKIGSEIRLFNTPENICEYGLDLVLRGIDINEYFDYLYEVSSQEIADYLQQKMTTNIQSIQILSSSEKGE